MTTQIPAEFQAVAPVLATIRERAGALTTIRSADQYEQAGELLKFVKGALRQIEEQRTSITKPMNDALRNANAQAKVAAAPFEEAERSIKAAMITFADEQERIRREEQRRLDEAARREREKLEAQAREAERKAREEAEAKRRAADEAAAAGRAAEAAKLAAQADRVEAKAAAKVEDLEVRAASVVAPITRSEAPKVAGTATREEWLFEITDPALVPREYLVIDESKIGKVVRALKSDTSIAGIRVYSRRVLAARSA